MVYAINCSSSATHRESCNGTSPLVFSNAVVVFYKRNQFLEEIVLVHPIGCTVSLSAGVEIHHVLLVAFWADHYHVTDSTTANQTVCYLRETVPAFPIGMCSTAAMHEVHHRIQPQGILLIAARKIDAILAFCDAFQHFAWHFCGNESSWPLLEVFRIQYFCLSANTAAHQYDQNCQQLLHVCISLVNNDFLSLMKQIGRDFLMNPSHISLNLSLE